MPVRKRNKNIYMLHKKIRELLNITTGDRHHIQILIENLKFEILLEISNLIGDQHKYCDASSPFCFFLLS